MAPPRRTETDRRAPERFRCEFATGDVQELNRQIEKDLRRQTGVTHDPAKPRGASRAEDAGEPGRQRPIRDGFMWCVRHASACRYGTRLIDFTTAEGGCMSGDSTRSLIRRASLLVLAAVLWMPTIASAQSPWERAASNLATTFTGPLARSLALVAIVIGGLLFMFGESGAKRQISGIVFGGGLALFAAQFLTWLF
jgi:type IV secretory pathway VirB2 component (pilin)